VSEKKLQTILTQYKSGQNQLAVLLEKKKKLDSCRKEIRQILKDSDIHCDPKLEENFKETSSKLNQIVKVRMQYEQCILHVQNAKSDLESALLLLNRADYENSYNLYDPFCYPGYLSDSWVYSDIGKAKNFVHGASIHLQIAKEVLPNVLKVKETELPLPDTLLYDVFFNDLYTELIIEQNIAMSTSNVKTSLNSVNEAYEYLQSVLKNINSDFEKTNNKYQQERDEIFGLKKKIVLDTLDGELNGISKFYDEHQFDETQKNIYTPSEQFSK
jgi:hypothetical protein